ncbi:hypothetical protein [Streptococcus hillyeri]|uniref:Uncharacterized protein n=1 Tax=Streptococcus hillyeri TaxID=2282420 RepID=A0A3L9DMS3_9STRE|nr:hypothetical protein [Streptococcus hillyeri]RLY01417.1 hypothetical protein EAF07_09620 [Streptococcus hillyeri]
MAKTKTMKSLVGAGLMAATTPVSVKASEEGAFSVTFNRGDGSILDYDVSGNGQAGNYRVTRPETEYSWWNPYSWRYPSSWWTPSSLFNGWF